jgi:hypothetical protein
VACGASLVVLPGPESLLPVELVLPVLFVDESVCVAAGAVGFEFGSECAAAIEPAITIEPAIAAAASPLVTATVFVYPRARAVLTGPPRSG